MNFFDSVCCALFAFFLAWILTFGFDNLIDKFRNIEPEIVEIECVEQEPNYNEIIDKYGLEKGLEIIEIIEGGN